MPRNKKDGVPINEVRTILMNELGLTREIIREELRNIIQETAAKYIRNLMEENKFGKLLLRAADEEIYRQNKWAKTITGYVKDGAKEAASEWVKNNIKIEAKNEIK